MNNPNQVFSFESIPIESVALEKPLGVTTVESCYLYVEMAYQVVLHPVSIKIFWSVVTESQTLFISCGSESKGVLVYLTGSIEAFCRENGNRKYPVAPVVDGVAFTPWSDIDVLGYAR